MNGWARLLTLSYWPSVGKNPLGSGSRGVAPAAPADPEHSGALRSAGAHGATPPNPEPSGAHDVVSGALGSPDDHKTGALECSRAHMLCSGKHVARVFCRNPAPARRNPAHSGHTRTRTRTRTPECGFPAHFPHFRHQSRHIDLCDSSLNAHNSQLSEYVYYMV